MERVSQRENLSVNYAAERLYERSPSSSSGIPKKSSDLDFNDVFGGPPRRFSVQTSDGAMSSEEAGSICSFGSDKPVFGEETSVRRRKHHQNNEFFDDIFRSGDKSCSSTGGDFVNSLPGSGTMSPSRLFPPKLEPFGTSLPAHFSLPATLTNAMEYPTFASSSSSRKKEGTSNGRSSPNYSLSRLSSQTMLENDHFRGDASSPLSNEFSGRNAESMNTSNSNETDRRMDLNDTSKSTEAPTEFHFSFYKWAGNGIPIVIPLRERIISKAKEMDVVKEHFGSEEKIKKDMISVNSGSYSMDLEKVDKIISSRKEETCNFVKEEVLCRPEPDILISEPATRIVSDSTALSNKIEETRPNYLAQPSLFKKAEKEATVFMEKGGKPELKRLHLFQQNAIVEQGSDDITAKAERKDNVSKTIKVSDSSVGSRKIVKEHEVEKIKEKKSKLNKNSIHDSPKNRGSPKKSGGRGKVKEFARLFTQEMSSKSKSNLGDRSQSCRWEGKVTGAKTNYTNVGTSDMYNKIHLRDTKKTAAASFVVVGNVEQPEKHHLYDKSTITTSTDDSSDKRESNPFAPAELTPDDSKVISDEDIDDLSQINYMIEELLDDQAKLPSSEDQETTEALDAKIQKWSTGKKGNIRSLLSTLQYVLWTESGWKPIPLVNIVEGNGVKRAYQRAMLCLHPDKLQQKGASVDQKYTAEKVFNILQEAWDQFNLLGLV